MPIVVTPIPRLIDLAAPAFTLGTANAAGSAETAVASDSTLLTFDTTLPAAVGTAAVGSATVAPRRDHVHAGTTLAAPSLTLGTANSAGAASTVLATDATLLAFDTTLPAATGTAAVGSATVAPRRDHVHASTVAATVVEMEAASSNTVFATPGRTQNHPGVAKVWVKWEQDSAHGIIGSYNMTSVTDGSGAGDTDHLWNTDFEGTAYGFSAMGGTSGYFIAVTGATQASTGVTSVTTLHDGVATDRSANYLVAYGDQ